MTTRTRLVSVLLWPCLVAALSACETDSEPRTAASSGASAPTTSSTATERQDGEPAVWMLGPNQNPHRSSTTFTALVSRLDCNGGVTGRVLPPQVRTSETEVIVTFFVTPKQSDPAPCQSNDQVSYDVELGEPLQGRALVDGHCLPGQRAVTTVFCTPDGTRFKP